jgi:uncharacterized membrane protein HdeD (DUF308 family)
MNSLFEKYKWLKYVIGALIISLGVLIIVLACLALGRLQDIINIVVAVSLLIIGLILLIVCLLYESHKGFTLALLFASISITSGVVLLVGRFGLHESLSTNLIVYIISLATLVFGVAALVKGISLIVYKERKGLIALMLIVGIVGITLGILGLCFANKLATELATAAYILLGVLLVAAGVLFIAFAIIGQKKKKEQ